ncbi:MAG: helix-turn-helix domain-containing protein [Eubacteriales bacterium]
MRLRKEDDNLQEEEILFVSRISDALAHPVRIKIFKYILKNNASRNPVCNKNVVLDFDYSQATISQHIKKLLQADLVQIKRVDKFSMYYANIGILGKYMSSLKKFEA